MAHPLTQWNYLLEQIFMRIYLFRSRISPEKYQYSSNWRLLTNNTPSEILNCGITDLPIINLYQYYINKAFAPDQAKAIYRTTDRTRFGIEPVAS